MHEKRERPRHPEHVVADFGARMAVVAALGHASEEVHSLKRPSSMGGSLPLDPELGRGLELLGSDFDAARKEVLAWVRERGEPDGTR